MVWRQEPELSVGGWLDMTAGEEDMRIDGRVVFDASIRRRLRVQRSSQSVLRSQLEPFTIAQAISSSPRPSDHHGSGEGIVLAGRRSCRVVRG